MRHTPRGWTRLAGLIAATMCAAMLTARGAPAQARAAAAMAESDPTAMVKAVVDQASTVLSDTHASAAQRDQRLRAIAEANFDFEDMARTTLGYHWREITPADRAQFVPLFTSFMESVYLSKLEEYGVQKARESVNHSPVSFTGQEFDGANYAEVHSAVLLNGKPPPVKINYLLKRAGAGWKIYDLDIDAISVMANYRQQFNRVLNNQGYPELVSLLQRKVKELNATFNQ